MMLAFRDTDVYAVLQKTELLSKKERCPYQCMYCYWKEKSTKEKI